jgi:hypothetical protein
MTDQMISSCLYLLSVRLSLPKITLVDNGTELYNRAIDERACQIGIKLVFISPEKQRKMDL